MPIPALAIAGGSALASLLGGFFGGKKKAKNEEKRTAENDAAARRAWDQQEQIRIGRLKSILSAAQARGINVGTMDPSLLTPRPYPGPNSTVGMDKGPGWQDLLGWAGNVGMNYAGGMEADQVRGGPASRGSILEDPTVEELMRQSPLRSGFNPGPTAGDKNAGVPSPYGSDDWSMF